MGIRPELSRISIPVRLSRGPCGYPFRMVDTHMVPLLLVAGIRRVLVLLVVGGSSTNTLRRNLLLKPSHLKKKTEGVVGCVHFHIGNVLSCNTSSNAWGGSWSPWKEPIFLIVRTCFCCSSFFSVPYPWRMNKRLFSWQRNSILVFSRLKTFVTLHFWAPRTTFSTREHHLFSCKGGWGHPPDTDLFD